MSDTIVVLNLDLFERLLKHAPARLAKQASDNAAWAIPALCFTEADIWQKAEDDERWQRLPAFDQAAAVASLLEAGEYQHVTEIANEAIADAVARYLDDLNSGG
jgi:hypothetical protein